MNPKYQTVADALRAGIQEGKYQKTLPTEQALCAQFQVSRQTVRQALSLLEADRLIDRRQGSGSHIRERKGAAPRQRTIPIWRSVQVRSLTQSSAKRHSKQELRL